MAKTMDVRKLLIDDFFEIPGDPCIYTVDLVCGSSLFATNCQTGQMFGFNLKRVDFLYR